MRGEGGRGVSDDFGYVTIILPDPPQGSVIFFFFEIHFRKHFLVFTISKFYRKIVFFYLENCGSITYVFFK